MESFKYVKRNGKVVRTGELRDGDKELTAAETTKFEAKLHAPSTHTSKAADKAKAVAVERKKAVDGMKINKQVSGKELLDFLTVMGYPLG